MHATAERGRKPVLQAVRAELALAFTRPYTTPVVVAGNALLVAVAWTWLPVGIQDWLFHFHGALAFPMVLASWMLADVPATNVLGADPEHALPALDDPAALRRLLYAKSIALWLLVCPACALVALVVGAVTGEWEGSGLIAIWILVVPAGTLGFSSWLGILYPYHPQPLAWRWRYRRAVRRVIVRWSALVLAPYIVVPAIQVVVLAVGLLAALAVAGPADVGTLTDGQFAVVVVITSAAAAVAFVVGHRSAAWLAGRRRDELRGYLEDPERG